MGESARGGRSVLSSIFGAMILGYGVLLIFSVYFHVKYKFCRAKEATIEKYSI